MGGKQTREIPRRSVNSRTRRRHGIAAFNPARPAAAWSAVYAGWPRARAGNVGELDRSDRRWRVAGGRAAAAAGQGAQRRRDDVDWADPLRLHDEIASDKRNPVVNPNGPIYGALEASADYMPVVDPVTTRRRRSS